MDFGWDPSKSEATRQARGFGFAEATAVFDNEETLEFVDDRRDYGEVRVKAIGAIGTELVAVIYTDRDTVRWIISARVASRRERKAWHARFA